MPACAGPSGRDGIEDSDAENSERRSSKLCFCSWAGTKIDFLKFLSFVGRRDGWQRLLRVGLGPKLVSNTLRLDTELRPPSRFIAGPMQFTMMGAAERHRELVADLEAEASWLREAQVMGIRRLAAANDTGLGGDKFAM